MRMSRTPRTTPRKIRAKRSLAKVDKLSASPRRALTSAQLARLEQLLDERKREGLPQFDACLEGSTWLVEAARVRDVRLARWLIHSIVRKLRNKSRLLDVEQDFLADALEKILESPAKAGQELGLIPPKARPTKLIDERDWKIHATVRSAMRAGIPLKDGNKTAEWDGNGAISRVAAQFHVSTSTAKRAYAAVCKLDREIGTSLDLGMAELDTLIQSF
jgi:hypothetical protein